MKDRITIEMIIAEKTELQETIRKAIQTFRSNTGLNPIIDIKMIGTAVRNGELTIYSIDAQVVV